MPELSDDLYCSQQICIPPAFPYLLRQYAKAAIRTQPTDLLKWSTAYFRCLALNLPAPVKPRLEYPVPLDYFGITPGWLKALVYQINLATESVSFRLLWDRWIGACLRHETLIEILLLGRFDDNMAIPWLRFVGMCAGHLSENLTHTMIMVCEILTEEPEGGSAMLPVDIFLDIYKFLADIDASKPQTLPNIHFTDSVLGLYEKEEEVKEVEAEPSEETLVEEAEVEEAKAESIASLEVIDPNIVISCPDIVAEEQPLDDVLEVTAFEDRGVEVLPEHVAPAAVPEGGESVGAGGSVATIEDDTKIRTVSRDSKEGSGGSAAVPASGEGESGGGKSGSRGEDEKGKKKVEKKSSIEEELDAAEKERLAPPAEEEEVAPAEEEVKSADKQPVADSEKSSQETILEDVSDRKTPALLDKVLSDVIQQQFSEGHIFNEGDVMEEEMGEEEEEGEENIAEEIRKSINQQDEGGEEEGGSEGEGDAVYPYTEIPEMEIFEVQNDDALPKYEMVDVPAVPGIGPHVPQELVDIVVEYMEKMATIQHGVVMPRNIRHFSCPPMEIFD